MGSRCGDCKYFVEAVAPQEPPAKLVGAKAAKAEKPPGGACWRYPPVVSVNAVPQPTPMGQVQLAWATTNARPTVGVGDFCGEYSERERVSIISDYD